MPHITLLLHNIRSTYNVGSIFRSAEGFGVDKIILSGYTPSPHYPGDRRLPHIAEKIHTQIAKTALGAESLVPFEYIERLEDWLNRTDRPPVVALEQADSSQSLRSSHVPDTFALLLGEEVDGISPTYLEQCVTIVEIPMYGKKESFNVSVSAGIALYEFTSR